MSYWMYQVKYNLKLSWSKYWFRLHQRKEQPLVSLQISICRCNLNCCWSLPPRSKKGLRSFAHQIFVFVTGILHPRWIRAQLVWAVKLNAVLRLVVCWYQVLIPVRISGLGLYLSVNHRIKLKVRIRFLSSSDIERRCSLVVHDGQVFGGIVIHVVPPTPNRNVSWSPFQAEERKSERKLLASEGDEGGPFLLHFIPRIIVYKRTNTLYHWIMVLLLILNLEQRAFSIHECFYSMTRKE